MLFTPASTVMACLFFLVSFVTSITSRSNPKVYIDSIL